LKAYVLLYRAGVKKHGKNSGGKKRSPGYFHNRCNVPCFSFDNKRTQDNRSNSQFNSWRAFIAGKRGACHREKRLALVRQTAKPLAFFHAATRAFSYNAP
jgi:hypothetical protein